MTPNDSVRLSAKQRAKKIAAEILHPNALNVEWNSHGLGIIRMIAAQIEEAQREAVEADRSVHNNRVEEVCKEIYAEGFNAAREK